MKTTDTLSLDLFGEVRTDLRTLSQSRTVKQHSSNVKKKKTEFQPSNYTAVKKSKNTAQPFYCCKMGNDQTHIPCGELSGALPERIMINGVHWRCAITMVKDGNTYDLIINSETGEKKKLERNKLLNFILKNK